MEDRFPIEGTKYELAIEVRLESGGAWVARSFVYDPQHDEPVAGFRCGPDLSIHYVAAHVRMWGIRAARTIEEDIEGYRKGMVPMDPMLIWGVRDMDDLAQRFGEGTHEGGDDAH